jgi:hypothetical protein
MMDLSKLKEALETGEKFEGAKKLEEIIKKSDGINDLDGKEWYDIMDARKKRAEKSWDDLTEDQVKEMKADDAVKMEKRFEAQKNEMELAEIQVLENENIVLDEYINNLMEEINDKKRKVDSNNNRIDELQKIIDKTE